MLAGVATPTSVTVVAPPSSQGSLSLTSENNSSTATELSFQVAGVTAGDTVNVYADGSNTPVATSSSPVPTGQTTITLKSNGTNTLQDGTHTFTATQTDTSSNVSASSPASASVTVFAGLSLTQTAVSATVGTPSRSWRKPTPPAAIRLRLPPGAALLPNMTFTASNNTFSGWTPTSSEVGTTQSFTVALTDSIGNSTTVSVFVTVAATSNLSVFTPPTSLVVGSPVLVAFNDFNSGTPNYTVTTSNPSELTATIMKENSTTANPVLQIVTNVGTMDIELLDNYTPNTVAHIESLINSGTYANNATFYRIIEDFMVQGGAGGTGSTIPVELNADLRFTSSGLLAMANDGVDGNSSEFFITGPDDLATNPSSGQPASNFSDGFLDFRYTIFGKLIEGDNVRQALAETQVGPDSSGEFSEPFAAPQIESMSIVSQPDAGVFLLKAASSASGPLHGHRDRRPGRQPDLLGQRQRHESVRSAQPLGRADQRHRYNHDRRQHGGEVHAGGRIRRQHGPAADRRAVVPAPARVQLLLRPGRQHLYRHQPGSGQNRIRT